MEEQSTGFICITQQGKQNGSVILTIKASSWSEHKLSLYTDRKCMGRTANIAKNRYSF